ncbi:MAG TPA: DUF1295 domain-containing protein [Caulobacteraceae bacterium]|jgi:steroid 5-alpha reductase family enzyme|nr:DUF1295 domain-containing protein [Caulobacteraceae bacterium]
MRPIIEVFELTGAVVVAMTAIMAGAWLTQRALKNGGWVDVFWTFGSGLCLSVAAMASGNWGGDSAWRRVLMAVLLVGWSVRLGGHVAVRVARDRAEDARYAAFRTQWGGAFQRRMFGLVIVQAPVTGLLALSVISAAENPDPHWRVRDALGLAVFLAAAAGEAIADRQLGRFRSNRQNAGKVCERGLWSWSRHPNYFFEAAVWLAWPLMGLDLARPWTLMTLVAPLVMYLTVRFASGVPPLEAAMLASRGEAYAAYQRRVSVLLPLPPRR